MSKIIHPSSSRSLKARLWMWIGASAGIWTILLTIAMFLGELSGGLWAAGLMAILAFLVLVHFVISDFLLAPLMEIDEGLRSLAQRKFGVRIQTDYPGEFGQLAKDFNRMAEEIAAYTSELEVELHQAQKLASIGRVSAGLAHEIAEPMRAISSLTPPLLRNLRRPREEIDETAEDLIRQLELSLKQCQDAARKLIDTQDVRELDSESLDLNEIVRDVIIDFQRHLHDKDVALNVPDSASPILVWGDKAALSQLINQLLSNAVDAVQGGGTVQLETEYSSEEMITLLRVRDDGVGIPADQLENVFKPFFTTKHATAGVGLGLAMCRSIARAHGGELTASLPDGSGTEFVLRLPSAESEMQRLKNKRTKTTTSRVVAES